MSKLFHYKDRSSKFFDFRDLCSKNFLRFFLVVKPKERDEKERALSPLASRFFRSALFLTRGTVGGRKYIVNDRGLG